MSNKTFNRKRLSWLNGICRDSLINDRSFRVAFALADHFNSVTGHAWPSINRLAERLHASGRTIQRGVGELEKRGWLSVSRRMDRSNHYRMAFPVELCLEVGKVAERDDANIVGQTGHFCRDPQDRDVRQTFLSNLSRTSSSRLSEGDRGAGSDRGLYELRIAERYGPEIWNLFEELARIDPPKVQSLCDLERRGALTIADIETARLFARLHTDRLSNPSKQRSEC